MTWSLPGSGAAEAQVRAAAERGTLAHALLLSGEGAGRDAALLCAAAFLCTASAGRPCGRCAACRKVERGIHPDVAEVRDDGHKALSVDVIRAVRADVYVRPNEGARKVYLFPDCSLLTEQDQNVLLKIVEEGPAYAAFLFCAENPALVLPTLRSRCVELPLRRTAVERGGAGERAAALCRALAAKKPCGPTDVLIRLERDKLTRDELRGMLEECCGVLTAALELQIGRAAAENVREIAAALSKNLTKTQIMRTIELLQTYRRECRYNVSAGQTLGALAAELEGIF